ncbi:proline dehydrogenase family protein [Paenibacillus filicis]|uniref:proline dehydrogenase n=1 Tax=Paenibacillus gyeongsangnamensis TaxID=3388067 RepID=A0ABT4Q3C3_9BACL|nr:proline dehydrogenase family protein [Paenibacillus filicis]MCZ8511336.1 proline dehydrogenase family protein [Paenibacillus filicis]
MELGTRLFRSILLTLAGNRAVEAAALRYGLQLGAARFVAGVTLEEAMLRVADLEAKGISVTLDHLGEGVRTVQESESFMEEYLRMVDRLAAGAADVNVSLKPTQMGLALDEETTCTYIRQIVRRAEDQQGFVCLDMENSPYTDATLRMVRRLRAEGLNGVGTVVQACMRRSLHDVDRLTRERVPLRLVKGAYKEPKPLVLARKQEVDENFIRLIGIRLSSGVFTSIATHDERIIRAAQKLVRRLQVPPDRFEFQMLYGVASPLQERLVQEGYKVRCYVPYGRKWYPYFVRRLAERPANLWFVIKNW